MNQAFSLRSKLRVVKQQKKAAVYGYWARLQKELVELRQESVELEARASKHPVSGLDNRESISTQYKDLIANRREEKQNNRREKEKGHVAVIFGDIDHFKSVNDTYGHDVGDEALRLVGDKLTETARAGDIPYHLSGDEFGVVLPNVETLEEAMIAAERARKAIAESSFVTSDGHEINLSMSLGVVLADPETDVMYSDIYKKADKAAYRSKDNGRNRVTAMRANGDLVESNGDITIAEASLEASESPEFSTESLSFLHEELLPGSMHEQFKTVKKEITERKKLNAKLEHSIRHDEMTGLFNRTGAGERYKRLQAKMVRSDAASKQIATLLIDINNFKKVNTDFGHPVGDVILKDTAKIIKDATRHMDIDCRWGGEEFVISAEVSGRTGALRIAKRIEDALEKYQLDVDGRTIRPRASIGIGLHKPSEQTMTLDEAVKPADLSMYDAKRLAKKNNSCTVISLCENSQTTFYGKELQNEKTTKLDVKGASSENRAHRFNLRRDPHRGLKTPVGDRPAL